MKAPVLIFSAGVGVCLLAGCARGGGKAQEAVPSEGASAAFKEADEICRKEGGALWGRSLCGPMMFADRATRQAVLNAPSPGAVRDGAIFRLQLPEGMGVANTSVELGGERWTMIMWPLPQEQNRRRILMMHESYHRLQPALGLQGGGGLGTNGHLDTREGRTWLRAEFRALDRALGSVGEARRSALADALLFRAYRRSLWPEAGGEERALELNEGLAESTGVDAASSDAAARIAAARADLAGSEAAPTFVRSFAYGTGPAYGELLDAARPDWRRAVRPDFDFGAAAASAYDLALPTPSAESAQRALERYGGSEVLAQEAARQKALDERDARFAKLFVDGPTVAFPLKNMSITFDPRDVASFRDLGSVYGTLEIADDWGTLKVESGAALISKDFKVLQVPATQDAASGRVSGKGWTADLTKGYELAPDSRRPGSFGVQKRT
jgi:hypothetical protein